MNDPAQSPPPEDDVLPPVDLKNPIVAGVLALLVPGLGHLYQGRFGKAVLFFVCVLGLFFAGIKLATYKVIDFRMDRTEWNLAALAQGWTGVAAWPGLIPIKDLDKQEAWRSELDDLMRKRGRDHELGRILTMVAGLLNLLVIGDAVGGPAFRAEEVAAFNKRRDKLRTEAAA